VTRSLMFNPGPTNVHDEVRRCLLETDVNHRDPRFRDVLAQVRTGVVDLLELDDTHVCIPFAASGTGANEAVLAAVRGPLIVLVCGHYSCRLADIGERLGLVVERLTFDRWQGIDCDVLRRALEQSPPGATVCLVHHETTTGMLAPLERICALSRRHGATLAVDGISSLFGHRPASWSADVDYYTVTSNKCLESVPGLAFVVARRSLLEPPTTVSRSYYFDLRRQWLEMTSRGEPPFTQSYGCYLAAATALRRLDEETVAGRHARYSRLRDRLADGLATLGFEAIRLAGEQATWLQLYRPPPWFDYADMRSRLAERGINVYTDAATLQDGLVAFATLGAIEAQHVDALVEAIAGEAPVRRPSEACT
jgi:2-aminoethylphosphonate-pyruvate transaminase